MIQEALASSWDGQIVPRDWDTEQEGRLVSEVDAELAWRKRNGPAVGLVH